MIKTPPVSGRGEPTETIHSSRRSEWNNPAVRDTGPTITAVLEGGPLDGRLIEADVVEGRPPKTIDATADDGTIYRYCLAEWEQAGASASYTFLYPV